ncbi:molybdate ABC transporter substrate-binding protein [uncultured Desulfosarcina sp.]|uniref:molybdate ABC transporter substrate-binding protein n=1 Tax=uncultured Desulfosarcina sp. TaxID=218289 RepID=UPI0029C78E32|nr:molybdate ABC transporter substrate-binding protein [uncultured Desulfosarcina sp.]
MRKRWVLLLSGGVAFLFGIGFFQPVTAGDLHIFVGAGLRQPVDQMVKAFEDQTGHRVFIDYGGSGQLLARIEAAGRGDLFVPGALFYIEKLEKAGKIRSFRPIVQHTPVVGVNVNQAQRITTFDDLAKPGIRLAMGDPKAMAFGRTAMAICERSGMRDAILKNVTVYGATVKQLAMYVSQGAVDAAIIGRADAFQNRETIVILPIPPDYFQAEIIAAAVLRSATDPELAGQLADHLNSESGVAVFQRYGFLPLDK